EGEHAEIVGLIGNIPFDCHFHGRNLTCSAACAWVVDPPFRRFSMALLDSLMEQPGVDLIVSTTVSANSEPALRFLGWSRVPSGTWDQSAFWIANYRSFARSALSLKSVLLPGLFSYPLAGALFCLDLLKMRLHSGVSNVELRFSTQFDT